MQYFSILYAILIGFLVVSFVCMLYAIFKLMQYYNMIKVKRSNAKLLLSDDSKQAIENIVLGALNTYHNMALRLHTSFVILGATAIIGSVFVTTFISEQEPKSELTSVLPFISFISTSCLTLTTAFNLSNKANNCRKAWRHLEYAYNIYKGTNSDIKALIDAKMEAEEIIGGVEFKYTL